jgi:hemoglobin/transferrin/lactoferrin receptor protein
MLRPTNTPKLAALVASTILAAGSALHGADPQAATAPAEPTVSAVASEDAVAERSNSRPQGIRVVVSANRGLAESDLDVPQAVSVIDREFFESGVVNDVNTAIRREASVGLAPADGTSNYWNPGFTVRGLGGQRVLTLTNGVRQAGQGIGYGGGALSLYDPMMIERVEILRGPRSVIYGTDAIGGVIDVQTRKPTRRDAFGMNGGLRYELDEGYAFDRYSGFVDVGDSSYGFVAGFYHKDADRPKVPGPGLDQGSFEQYGGWAQLDWYLNDRWTWSFVGNTDQNRDVLIADDTITLPQLNIPGPPPVTTFSAPLFFQLPEYNRNMLGTEWVMEDAGAQLEYLKAGIYWQQIQREFRRESLFFQNAMSPGPASPLETDVVDTDDVVDTVELQLLSRWNLGLDHLLTAGVDLGYDRVDLQSRSVRTVVSNPFFGPPFVGTTTITERQRADADQVRAGIYVQDRWTRDRWEWTAGLRLDHFDVSDSIGGNDRTETGLSGSLSGVYEWDEATRIYGTLASGFRVPDLGERYQDAVVNIGVPSRVVGNPDLEPERSWSGELGLKHETAKLRASLAVFYNYVQDYINDNEALGLVAGTRTTRFQNAGDAVLYGIELELSYFLTPEWELFGNLSRTATPDDDIVNVPNWVANYGTAYTWTLGNSWVETLTPSLFLRTVTGSRDTARNGVNRPDYGGFTVADFQVEVQLSESRFGDMSLVGGIRNLGDKAYREPFFDAQQPERSAYLSVQYRF